MHNFNADKRYAINMINKYKILDKNITYIKPFLGSECILLSISDNDHLLYIPDDVIKIHENENSIGFNSRIRGLMGKLRVIGGASLVEISRLFSRCKAYEIDLRGLDTSHVENMTGVFEYAEAAIVRTENLNTSNVTTMKRMFNGCNIISLDLNNFDTSKVVDMFAMFKGASTSYINVSSFDTSSNTNFEAMFSKLTAPKLDLSNFVLKDTHKVKGMLHLCNIKDLIVPWMNNLEQDTRFMIESSSIFALFV